VNFVSIFVFSISPGLGRVIGAGEHAKARRVRAEVMGLTWLIVTAAGATLLVWNRAFVSLWVGVQHDAGRLSTLLIVLLSAQFIFIRNDANVIDLTLDSGASPAGRALGVRLACRGRGAGRRAGVGDPRPVCRLPCRPHALDPHLSGDRREAPGDPGAEQAGPVARAALVTVAVFGLAIGPGSRIGAGTWPGLVAGAALTAAVLLGVCWFAGLSPTAPRTPRPALAAV